jgi:hypothetical protein
MCCQACCSQVGKDAIKQLDSLDGTDFEDTVATLEFDFPAAMPLAWDEDEEEEDDDDFLDDDDDLDLGDEEDEDFFEDDDDEDLEEDEEIEDDE